MNKKNSRIAWSVLKRQEIKKGFVHTSFKALFTYIIGSSYPRIIFQGSSACVSFYQLASKSACLPDRQLPWQPGNSSRRSGRPEPAAAAAAGSRKPSLVGSQFSGTHEWGLYTNTLELKCTHIYKYTSIHMHTRTHIYICIYGFGSLTSPGTTGWSWQRFASWCPESWATTTLTRVFCFLSREPST